MMRFPLLLLQTVLAQHATGFYPLMIFSGFRADRLVFTVYILSEVIFVLYIDVDDEWERRLIILK